MTNSGIKIEKFTSADFADYFRLVGDIHIMAMITERALPLEEAKTEFETLLENNRLHENLGSFKIMAIPSGEFIGFAKLQIEKANANEAELGYMVLREYWGNGIASDVARQLIGVAKTIGSLKRLFAIIDPKNIPSRKILTKNGFAHRECKDFDGLPGEILELGI